MENNDFKAIKDRLIKGNLAFRGTPYANLDTNEELRAYLTNNGQHPYAIVFACSDSRVNPEAIFSAGLGELFVVRSAGQALLDGEFSSIAYAVNHLHAPYVLVLGHTCCGAVGSVLAGAKEKELQPLLDYVETAIAGLTDPRKAEEKNARYTANLIQERLPHAHVESAIYDIASGEVRFLD